MFIDQFYEEQLSVRERNIKLLTQKLMQKFFYYFLFLFSCLVEKEHAREIITSIREKVVLKTRMSFFVVYIYEMEFLGLFKHLWLNVFAKMVNVFQPLTIPVKILDYFIIASCITATKTSTKITLAESTTNIITIEPQNLHHCNRRQLLHNCYRKCHLHSSNRNGHLQN